MRSGEYNPLPCISASRSSSRLIMKGNHTLHGSAPGRSPNLRISGHRGSDYDRRVAATAPPMQQRPIKPTAIVTRLEGSGTVLVI